MRRKIAVVLASLVASAAAVPAQAALDEGGGAGQPSPVVAVDEGFDWTDAGIGAGFGVALAAALGAGIAVRRHHGETGGVARPASQ